MKVVLISVTYTVAGRGKVWQVKVRERLRAPARVPRRGGGRARRLLHVVQSVAVDSIVPGVSVIISRRQVAATSILGKYTLLDVKDYVQISVYRGYRAGDILHHVEGVRLGPGAWGGHDGGPGATRGRTHIPGGAPAIRGHGGRGPRRSGARAGTWAWTWTPRAHT